MFVFYVNQLVVTSGSSFTCPTGPEKTDEAFPVKAGDKLTFNTNEAAKYGKNMKCKVNYIMEASCNMMKMSCVKMELGDGDILSVERDDTTKKYEIITTHYACIK